MFGCLWEAVGERGRGRVLEIQGSWLKNIVENLKVCEFIFLSVSPLQGTGRERLGLTQENGGQMVRWTKQRVWPTLLPLPQLAECTKSFCPLLVTHSPVGPGLPMSTQSSPPLTKEQRSLTRLANYVLAYCPPSQTLVPCSLLCSYLS